MEKAEHTVSLPSQELVLRLHPSSSHWFIFMVDAKEALQMLHIKLFIMCLF